MMDLERRSYNQIGTWKSGDLAPDEVKALVQSGQDIEYKKLQEYENSRIKSLSRRINVYHIVSSFFPTTFYLSSSQELSSKGYLNFIRFYRYTHTMKYRFIKFYIEKKFYIPLPASGVEPFVKGDENLFEAESRLPDYFPLGVSMTLLYSLAMLTSLYKSRLNEPACEPKQPNIQLKEGEKSLFILCETRLIKSEISRYFHQQPHTSCLEKINALDFRFDLPPEQTFKQLCKINRADENQAAQNLALLGFNDPVNDPSNGANRETILKIYAAIKMSGDHEYIVLDDFFKNESHQFEKSFLTLLTTLETAGKRIIYLSCEMHNAREATELKDNHKVNNYMIFPLLLDKVTMR